MKKILMSLAVALLISLLAVSASAAGESDPDLMQEANDINLSIMENMSSMDLSELDYDVQVRMFREAYLAAGWTEVNGDIKSRESDIAPETLELAYMDIDKAGGRLREKILAAREEVIYSHSWVNDTISGVMMASIDSNNRQFSITPKFSELFPGWEVPKSEAADAPVPAGSAEEVSAPNKTAGNLLNGAKATVKNAETIYNKDTWIYKNSTTSATDFWLDEKGLIEKVMPKVRLDTSAVETLDYLR